MIELRYEPDGEVLRRFLLSKGSVNIIQGPRGGGKSTVCCYKLLLNATSQPRGPDGIRHRRSYVVRNTYDDLQRTTIKTWEGVFPPDKFGAIKRSRPFEHRIRTGDLDWEVVFLALDNEEDRRKLLSAEVSDVWFNEMREMLRVIVDDTAPIFRFPARKDGGPLNPMVIGDTNAPNEGHFIAIMSGQVPMPEGLSADQRRQLTKPESWRFFIQPPAMIERLDADGDVVGYEPNPAAENIKWLPSNYYPSLIDGKTRAWIRVNVMNRPGQLVSGLPAAPHFRREAHVARETLAPFPGYPILVGVDFGRTPAAVMGQLVFQRWYLFREFCAQNMGAKEFARLLKPEFALYFPGFQYRMWGDPAGDHLAEADDIAPFQMFRSEGWTIWPAPTNDPTKRRAAVDEIMQRAPDGKSGLLVDPGMLQLISALEGGYHFRRMKVQGERYAEEVEKNMASHVAEAMQYVVIGAGEGVSLVQQKGEPRRQVVHALVGSAAVPGRGLLNRGWGGLRRRGR